MSDSPLDSRIAGQVLDRGWAAGIATAAAAILWTSDVGLNLWYASGTAADALALIYIAAMAFIVAEPNNLKLHRITFPLSVLFWGGRAGGFIELVVTLDRSDLWGAVAERAAMLSMAATLHLLAARRIGHTEALAEHGIEVPRG